MRVWTKPELIVDRMELSQVYAVGCDIKRIDNPTYKYWKNKGNSNNPDPDSVVSFQGFDELKALAEYVDPSDTLDTGDVKAYFDYKKAVGGERFGKLYNS